MKTTFGFKAHMNVDEDGFVSSVMTTAGNVHDSQCLEELLTGAETAVYADSAYASVRHDGLLKQKNIKNGILKRAYRNRPFTTTEKQHNKCLSNILNRP
jgi:IS5 family transposase